jgi:hypothetical protein
VPGALLDTGGLSGFLGAGSDRLVGGGGITLPSAFGSDVAVEPYDMIYGRLANITDPFGTESQVGAPRTS